jgi:hypothetical protein
MIGSIAVFTAMVSVLLKNVQESSGKNGAQIEITSLAIRLHLS